MLVPPLAPSIDQERHSPINFRCEILVYRIVISTDRWPSHFCIVLKSIPLSARA